MPNNILVTGAAGFIGSNFVRYWLAHYPHDVVTALDALTNAGNRASLQGLAIRFVHANICDYENIAIIVKNHAINLIVHFAAETHVDRSIAAPDVFLDTNIQGTHNLLKAARAGWGSNNRQWRDGVHFHHVSTDEVYGALEPNEPPFDENHRFAPNSPYAATKAAGDHLVRAYFQTYGLPVTVSNCSNNYGPFQFAEKLIPRLIVNILRGRPIPIFGDGRQIRDWLFVDDHCRAIDRIISGGTKGEVYNVGGNEELSNLSVIEYVCETLDKRFQNDPSLYQRFPNSPCAQTKKAVSLKLHIPDRLGHDRRYAINANKLKAQLGFEPLVRFKQGIEATVDWYLENQQWWGSQDT